jgi:hypothetical protein
MDDRITNKFGGEGSASSPLGKCLFLLAMGVIAVSAVPFWLLAKILRKKLDAPRNAG